MKGIQKVRIFNKKIKYDFELSRNITVIRGDSGTGKTSLYDMIAEYTRLGKESGVNIECKKNCVALTDTNWESQLKGFKNSIVFIDEGFKEINSPKFAKLIKNSDNYYVIFNRENLYELPYSVEEIYQIKTSGKLHTLKKIYSHNRKYIYSGNNNSISGIKVILTEDSKAGFQLYYDYFKDSEIECIPAESNSNIFSKLKEYEGQHLFVIADGAAFGSEMGNVMKLCDEGKGLITLCLPESFEWLILKSGIITEDGKEDILNNPSNYIDGMLYFSWEQFFTAYLKNITKDKIYKYSKSRLGKYYKTKANEEKVLSQIMQIK